MPLEKNNKISLVNLAGICDDSASSPANAFIESVNQCERETPSHVRAETIRSCIAQRFIERKSPSQPVAK